MTKLTATEVAALDPYKFMAVIGKTVIHPGGRASTQALLARAQITAASQVLDVGCGVATTAVEIARRFGAQVTALDIAPLMLERAEANVRAAKMTRVAVRPASIRKMAWLMPRMAEAVPYLGYILVAGHKPRQQRPDSSQATA